MSEPLVTLSTDVAVLGSGAAGMAAAVAAVETGLQVMVVDRSARPTPLYRLDDGVLNAVDPRRQSRQQIADSPERFVQDILEEGGYRASRELAEVLGYESTSLIDWLAGLGVAFEDRIFYARDSHWARAHRIKPDSPDHYAAALIRAAWRHGVTFAMKTTCEAVHPVENGIPASVIVRDVYGLRTEISARKGVVVALGGFAGNRAMAAWADRRLVRADPMPGLNPDGGSGLKLLCEAGAAFTGLSCWSFRCPREPLALLLANPQHCLLVNSAGERFVSEDRRSSTLMRAIASQPSQVWALTDFAGMQFLRGACRTMPPERMAIEAPGARALAARLAMPGESLDRTLSDYAAAVREGHDSLAADPRSPASLVRPIGQGAAGPLYAFAAEIQLKASLGGAAINRHAQVLDWNGRPLPGLFAAGDITGGVHGESALPGNMLLSALLFGRIAGRSAAASSLF